MFLGSDSVNEFQLSVDVPPTPHHQLDVLFIIDNTEGMEKKQRALAQSFRRFMDRLGFHADGLTDLHVGVISSDMGVGANPVRGCTKTGDSGVLRMPRSSPICSLPTELFLREAAVGDDLRLANFEGTLDEAFSCMANLGGSGCGFEQPLDAMRWALDLKNFENDGFYRRDAALAVVILSGEDDCSAYNDAMFTPNPVPGTDPSGGRTPRKQEQKIIGDVPKYRCFEQSVICDNSDDVGVDGALLGCHTKDDTGFMHSVEYYASFLKGLKPLDESAIVVTGLIDDSDLVYVHEGSRRNQPALAPSCETSLGPAYPAVRLNHFVELFGDRGHVSSACNADPLDSLAVTARQVRKAMGTHCLDGYLLDTELWQPGHQVVCEVWDTGPGRTHAVVACDNDSDPRKSSVLPCHTVVSDPDACGDFPTGLALSVCRPDGTGSCRNDPQPFMTHTRAECLVPPDKSERDFHLSLLDY